MKDKKWESILNVKMIKVMHGLLRIALLFYLKLVLTAFGFSLDDYYPYDANEMIYGSQMTVAWHVDDFKISHHSKK